MLLQILLDRDLQRRQSRHAGCRAAAERTEKLHTVAEAVGDLACGDHRTHRIAVRDRLAKDDDVRRDRVLLERPEMCAEPTEPGLHLVSDADTAGGTNPRVHVGEKAVRQHDLPADTGARFGDVSTQSTVRRLDRLDHAAHLRREPGASVAFDPARAIDIRDRRRMHPIRRAGAARTVVLVRTDIDQRRGVAVVGRIHHDQVALARVRARKSQRQLVRFAARGSEVADTQCVRHQRRQRFGVLRQLLLQIARVRVEQRQLFAHRANDSRVAVPDVRDVVVAIDITMPRIVVQILLPAAHDVQRRRTVRDAQVATDVRLACRRDLRLADVPRQPVGGNLQQQVRIGADAVPHGALAGAHRAIHVARHIEHIGDQLHVDMRPPVAIGRCAADACELRPFRDALADGEAVERIARQMAVERKELHRVGTARAVSQHDHRPIVVIAVGALEAVHRAVQRRVQR